MKARWLVLALAVPSLVPASRGAAPREADAAAVAAHNDVIYLAPAKEGWAGVPLGNGNLGAQVWHADAGLTLQLNTAWSGVYDGSLARLCVQTTPDMLKGVSRYDQRLRLADATLVTQIDGPGGTLHTTTFIDADRNVLVLRVQDDRADHGACAVTLETWRKSATHRLDDGRLIVTDALHISGEPDYRYALAVAVEGTAATGLPVGDDRVTLTATGRTFTVYLALAETRDTNTDVTADVLARLAEARSRGPEALHQEHAAWWRDFWSKSFIQLASRDDRATADYIANLWYMHLYAMAAGSRGPVPPKFNGGLWLCDRDTREWGPSYWHWNTQETYWPVFAANHLELHKPYESMYWDMLPEVKKWTTNFWETTGAQYQETIPFNGRLGNWDKDRSVRPRLPVPALDGYTSLILSSSAEIAMQFWWAYSYTGDEAFLRTRAYPLMKAVGAFYVNYLEKDASGTYQDWPSNAHETYWTVLNPLPDLTAMRWLFPRLIQASEHLNCDADLRPVWRDRLEHLASYPRDSETGALLPYQARPNEQRQSRNGENPELHGVGVFPLMILGSDEYDLGLRTFLARRFVCANGWNTDAICAARLGLRGDADSRSEGADQQHGLEWLLRQHAERYQNQPSGLCDYAGRARPPHAYLEASGTLATAVGEMLLQSFDGVIRICPALPAGWDATFKLLAHGGFLISAHAEQGKLRCAWILAQRDGAAAIANPFGREATVRLDGRVVLSSADPVLRFEARNGRTYVLCPAGTESPELSVTAETNSAPKRLGSGSARWIGLPTPEVAAQARSAPRPPEPPPPSAQSAAATPQEAARPAPGKVTNPDLAGHWTFGELDGPWVPDMSGHDNAGRVIGAVRLVEGRKGKALEFTGGYVSVAPAAGPHRTAPDIGQDSGGPDADLEGVTAANDLNGGGAFTVALWVQPTAPGAGRLVDKGHAGRDDGYMLDVYPRGRLRVMTGVTTFSNAGQIPMLEWTHLAVTYGDRTMRVFVNGKLTAEHKGLRDRIAPTSVPLRIGGGAESFTGKIEDVRFYRIALTAEQIAELAR